MSLKDKNWMQKALRLAVRGIGRVAPNPPVGCVIVKEDKVVGRGWTQPGGRPHAEVMALQQAGQKAEGATAYCTLEPCSHFGKTPPCCDALIKAGISKVVVAVKDPDSRVDGRGIKRLREAGLRVLENVCKEEALDIMQGFFNVCEFSRPYVTLKFGMSLDSRVAAVSGESKWITGDQARRSVHLLRAKNDAILTGVGTLLHDDPRLDCRLPGLEQHSPSRILVDSKLRIPVTSHFALTAKNSPSYVFTTEKSETAKKDILTDMGIKIFQVPCSADGHVLMPRCFELMAEEGITTVLVEAGGHLASSLTQSDLVDKLVIYRAPMIIGDDGIAAWHPLGVEQLCMAKTFAIKNIEQIGPDIIETYTRCTEAI